MQLDMLNVDTDVESNEDFLPGDFTKNTGMVPFTVDVAFMGESIGGAISVTLHLKEVGGNGGHRETFYVTSGKAKGRTNTYVDKRTGKKRLLPGMEAMNQLAIITTGNKLGALSTEEKTIKLWNFEERKELPTKVPVLIEMIGKQVLVAITKCRENKKQKVGNEYVATAAERNFNEAGKFLHPDGHTVAEKIAEEMQCTYRDNWIAKYNSDYVKDTYKDVTPGNGVAAASAVAADANGKQVGKLFD